jgi:hypothetical protein
LPIPAEQPCKTQPYRTYDGLSRRVEEFLDFWVMLSEAAAKSGQSLLQPLRGLLELFLQRLKFLCDIVKLFAGHSPGVRHFMRCSISFAYGGADTRCHFIQSALGHL